MHELFSPHFAELDNVIYEVSPSPLIMSADLRTIRPEFKEILLNRNLIKLNQVRGEEGNNGA